MRAGDIGALPVCNDKLELIGIVTDRDIIMRAFSGASPADVRISDIMTHDVVTADENMNVHDAALLFSYHRVRRLPVTSGRRLTGMLSISDIARHTVMADEAGDIMCAISKG